MNKLILQKHCLLNQSDDSYIYNFLAFNEEAFILSSYLCSNLPCGTLENEKKFIASMPINEEIFSNSCITCMRKDGFEITYQFNEDSAVVLFSRENIITVLNEWEKINEIMPNWVVIYFDKDSISMTPYHELPDEELEDPKKCYSASFAAFDLYEERIDRKRRTRLGNFFHKTLKQIKTYCKPYLGDD